MAEVIFAYTTASSPNGNSHSIGFFRGCAVLIFYSAGSFLVGDKAVHISPVFQPGGDSAPRTENKNRLDSHGIKAAAILHICADGGYGSVYEGKALPHISDVFSVIRGHTSRNHTAMKAQIHCRVVVVCSAESRAQTSTMIKMSGDRMAAMIHPMVFRVRSSKSTAAAAFEAAVMVAGSAMSSPPFEAIKAEQILLFRLRLASHELLGIIDCLL